MTPTLIIPPAWVLKWKVVIDNRSSQLRLPLPSMTIRGPGHRKRSTEQAYYHAVPQSPLAPNPVALPEILTGSLVLDPENDEDVVEETVLAIEVTPATRWVYFVFGCAVLLSWNCKSFQNGPCVATVAHSSLP